MNWEVIRIVADCHAAGVVLEPRPQGVLRVKNASNMPPELAERIRRHKPELRDLLVDVAAISVSHGHTDADAEQNSWPDLLEALRLEPPLDCPQCGGVMWWWDATGQRHCGDCRPRPARAEHIRQAAMAARVSPRVRKRR